MEMAQALQTDELISKQDMAKMKLICKAPPEYTPERATAIRRESPRSGKHPSGTAAKLLQLIDKEGP